MSNQQIVPTDPSVYQVISSFNPLIGGAERAVENLSRGLVLHGYNTQVITAWHAGLSRTDTIRGVPVRRLGLGGVGKLRSLTFGLHTLFWVLRHDGSIPIIHTHNIDTPLILGMLLRLLGQKRWVVTIQGEKKILDKRRTFPGSLRLRLMRRLAHHFVAITAEVKRVLLEEGVSLQCISQIPNGVDTDYLKPASTEERESLRARYGYTSSDLIILYLGRLIPSKRADLLLRAFANLGSAPRTQCLIVGGGSEAMKLRALAKDLHLDPRVRFTGPVNNVRDFYWLCDLFVLPTMFEGLPVALLESMACGVAVLVTKCPGNLQVVEDGVNGLTCQVDDLTDLSRQLQALVNDCHLRSALGAAARQSVVSAYSVSVVSAAHLEVYARVLGTVTEKSFY